MDLVGGLLGQGGQVSGAQGQGHPLMGAVMGLIQYYPGGLQGLLGQFQEKGLGNQVAPWEGTGANQPIGPEQVQAALGLDQLQQRADQPGLSHGEAASGLAGLLPQVLDKLSPEGSLPEGGGPMNLLMGPLG